MGRRGRGLDDDLCSASSSGRSHQPTNGPSSLQRPWTAKTWISGEGRRGRRPHRLHGPLRRIGLPPGVQAGRMPFLTSVRSSKRSRSACTLVSSASRSSISSTGSRASPRTRSSSDFPRVCLPNAWRDVGHERLRQIPPEDVVEAAAAATSRVAIGRNRHGIRRLVLDLHVRELKSVVAHAPVTRRVVEKDNVGVTLPRWIGQRQADEREDLRLVGTTDDADSIRPAPPGHGC